jgi:hypothetical protein
MKISTLTFAALLGTFAGSVAQADTLLVDRVEREQSMPRPSRGISMDQVIARYGEPSERMAPVGGGSPQQPPITRWVYPEFIVYFEHSHVIDAVAHRSMALEEGPKPPE